MAMTGHIKNWDLAMFLGKMVEISSLLVFLRYLDVLGLCRIYVIKRDGRFVKVSCTYKPKGQQFHFWKRIVTCQSSILFDIKYQYIDFPQ